MIFPFAHRYSQMILWWKMPGCRIARLSSSGLADDCVVGRCALSTDRLYFLCVSEAHMRLFSDWFMRRRVCRRCCKSGAARALAQAAYIEYFDFPDTIAWFPLYRLFEYEHLWKISKYFAALLSKADWRMIFRRFSYWLYAMNISHRIYHIFHMIWASSRSLFRLQYRRSSSDIRTKYISRGIIHFAKYRCLPPMPLRIWLSQDTPSRRYFSSGHEYKTWLLIRLFQSAHILQLYDQLLKVDSMIFKHFINIISLTLKSKASPRYIPDGFTSPLTSPVTEFLSAKPPRIYDHH